MQNGEKSVNFLSNNIYLSLDFHTRYIYIHIYIYIYIYNAKETEFLNPK